MLSRNVEQKKKKWEMVWLPYTRQGRKQKQSGVIKTCGGEVRSGRIRVQEWDSCERDKITGLDLGMRMQMKGIEDQSERERE